MGLIGGGLGLLVAVKTDAFGLFGSMPGFERFENPKLSYASLLYSSDGELLGKYYRTNRTLVSYDSISEAMKNTLLAVEDQRFFEHSGIDALGLMRAAFGILVPAYRSGGSTITMQLAENLYGTSTQNKGSLYKYKLVGKIVTKFKEWIIAVKLESNFTKKEILAMYLNTVPFGSNAFGIKAAAQIFFGIRPSELNYSQAALLIGIINAPTRYSPILNPENGLRKRNSILYKLYRRKILAHDEVMRLSQLPLELHYEAESHVRGTATYFRSVLKNYLLKWARERGYDLFADGLRIYVTLDSRLQAHAEATVATKMSELQGVFETHLEGTQPWIDKDGNEIEGFLKNAIRRTDVYKKLVHVYGSDDQEEPNEALWAELSRPRPMRVFSWGGEIDTTFSYIDSLGYYKHFLHAGFMAVQPNTGKIKAWVGGINYKYFKFDHVIQGKRQPGSVIKPFVYTAVIDNGYNPCYEVIDQPVTFQLPNQYPSTWTPSNAGGAPSGRRMTIRQAMARSVNSVTAYWMQKLGIQTVVRYAKRLGIQSHLSPVPALCLGAGGDVSVYEITGAYSTFVNKGIWTKPFFLERIEDKAGNILERFLPEKVEALSEEVAYVMLHMLKGTVEEPGGTSTGIPKDLREDNDIGAKTGTTQNASDGWFVGITQDLVACTWVGGEDRSIHFDNWQMGQGARTAMPIWADFMQKVYRDSLLGIRKRLFARPVQKLSIPLNCKQAQEADTTDRVQRVSAEDIF